MNAGASRSPRWSGWYVPQWIGTAMRGREKRECVGGSLGIEMPASSERWAPAPDRDESEVQAPAERGHLVEELGVAGEVEASRAGEEVPDGTRPSAERAVAPVFRVRRLDGQLAEGHALPHLYLDDMFEPAATQRPPSPRGMTTTVERPSC